MPRQVAIIGTGKMGQAVAALAPEVGWNVVVALDARSNERGAGITVETLRGAEVAVEFTEPDAAPANIRACVAAGCPVVVGTTGWYAELPAIRAEVEKNAGSLLWAPNFAVGVNVFAELVRYAGTLLATVEGFDAHVTETHHVAKKDAPSGTASLLRDTLGGALGRDVPVTSVRTGSVPGTHEVMLDAPFEQILLRHEARDRRVFASGALTAAGWLIGRRGVFTMRDMVTADSQ
ncbi:4-hydroxy-tetrahydrodipicolinate reductase [soil metagenome]